jgi:hypothetical protein
LAWRVVWYATWWGLWKEQMPWCLAHEISQSALSVSERCAQDVWTRFWWSGGVATRQGLRYAEPDNKKWSVDEDYKLIESILSHPRWQLKEHVAMLNVETRKQLSYRAVCKAAWRLNFSRQKLHNLAIKGDRDAAMLWLADVLADYRLTDLLFLDETSKDRGVLKGSYGYAIRGEGATICHDLPALAHGSRTSMLNVFSPLYGFLDHALLRTRHLQHGAVCRGDDAVFCRLARPPAEADPPRLCQARHVRAARQREDSQQQGCALHIAAGGAGLRGALPPSLLLVALAARQWCIRPPCPVDAIQLASRSERAHGAGV